MVFLLLTCLGCVDLSIMRHRSAILLVEDARGNRLSCWGYTAEVSNDVGEALGVSSSVDVEIR